MKRQKSSRKGKHVLPEDVSPQLDWQPAKQRVVHVVARNNNQKRALNYLNSGTPVVLLTGSAGTGKSLLAAYRAAAQLRTKSADKVILMRPAVATGKTVGLLPGDIHEKLSPYFRQTLTHLRKFLGGGNYFENKKIEMFPVEYARGNSFEDCVVIVEEAQNFTAEEFEMMLTRLGDNCQMIFTGDTKQHDLNGDSGLKTTVALLRKLQTSDLPYLDTGDKEELACGVGIVEFTPEDVVRSGLTRAFVKAYYNTRLDVR